LYIFEWENREKGSVANVRRSETGYIET